MRPRLCKTGSITTRPATVRPGPMSLPSQRLPRYPPGQPAGREAKNPPAYPGGPLPGDLEQDEIGTEYPGGY
jgi:hypothetical protein